MRRAASHPALENAISLLADLVGFPSISLRPNGDIVTYLETHMQDHGLTCLRDPHADGERFNLLGRIGPEGDGGILLGAHMDVVPANPDGWSANPFALRREEGRLYGRGAVDMKGFIAVVMAMLPQFQTRAATLRQPLYIALTFDEELGFFGAAQLPDFLAAQGIRPDIAIIGEPTGMTPFNGHKGGMELTTVVTGTSAHASKPAGTVNAIYFAARLVEFLRHLAEDLAASPVAGSPFDPPHTSLSVGTISGGEARNTIPDSCRIDWEIRALPGDDPHRHLAKVNSFIAEVLLPEMQAVDPAMQITTQMHCDSPPLEARQDSAAATLVARLWTNEAPQVVSFGTDAPYFQQAGMETVIFGPGGMAQMHQPDEYISETDLVDGLTFLDRLLAHMCETDGAGPPNG